MNGDNQQQTESGNARLRIWNWIFLCAQTVVVTLVVVSAVQANRGYKYIDIASYPITGTIVAVLFLVTPLFLAIVTPFFWNRLPLAVTGFMIGVIGSLYAFSPVF